MMVEKFEYKGKWWLPENPENKLHGTLVFTPQSGAKLELAGSFKDFATFSNIREVSRPEIILGTSKDGKDITLYKCIESGTELNIPGESISSFYADRVFVNAHFTKPEDIKFRSLSVHYSHLDEWTVISGFDIHLPSTSKEEIIIKYRRPEPLEVKLNDDYKINIDFRVTWPVINPVQTEASITQKAFITTEATEEKPFEEFVKLMRLIKNFLTLSVARPVHPLIIRGTTDANRIEIEGRPFQPEVGVYYQPIEVPTLSRKIHPLQMLFSLIDIQPKLDIFLKNWFEKADLLEPVYSLYFSTLDNPRLYLENQFLSLAHAIESYHRRRIRNEELSEVEHKKRIREIIDSVPDQYKKWLNTKLEYSNEPSFRKRLKEIYHEFSIITDETIGDKKQFARKVYATRNYLTHYDARLKDQAAKGEELFYLIQKLKMLIEICLLKELGFSLQEIKELFMRNGRYIRKTS